MRNTNIQAKIETLLFDPEQVKLIKSEEITFKHAAAGVVDKRKGHEFTFRDLISGSKWEITIEPHEFNLSPDKWLVYGSYVRYFCGTTLFYAPNLTQVFKKLNGKFTL